MKSLSAREAKNEFGRLIDLARAEPVTIEKHGRPVVVVMSVEEYERLTVAVSTRPAHGETGKGDRQ
jgi:prevent-host-death family protein